MFEARKGTSPAHAASGCRSLEWKIHAPLPESRVKPRASGRFLPPTTFRPQWKTSGRLSCDDSRGSPAAACRWRKRVFTARRLNTQQPTEHTRIEWLPKASPGTPLPAHLPEAPLGGRAVAKPCVCRDGLFADNGTAARVVRRRIRLPQEARIATREPQATGRIFTGKMPRYARKPAEGRRFAVVSTARWAACRRSVHGAGPGQSVKEALVPRQCPGRAHARASRFRTTRPCC